MWPPGDKPGGASSFDSRGSARHIEQRENHLRLAIGLIDPAIVVPVIDLVIVDIFAAILNRHAKDPARYVLAYPCIAVEPVTGVQSGKPRIGNPVAVDVSAGPVDW